jgi:prevent-host-death family protein
MPKKPVRRPTKSRVRASAAPTSVPSVIPAGRFKATCLAVMADVQRTGEPVTITRHGTPIVRVVPAVATDAPPFFGRAKGSVRITGDVLAPLDVEWTVLVDD